MISLITATYGRTEEVRTLLGSLARQSYKDFEFILVDQNPHFILREMVAEYASRLTIQYIRSEAKGLSLNRNIGLDYSRGEIVAFPDDDCFYEEDVLEKVIDVFQRQKDIVLVATAVKDAAAYAEQDKKRREDVDTRNNADQMIYQAEKTIADAGDKLDASDKAAAEAKIAELKTAMQGTDTEAIKTKLDELQKAFYEISEKLYKAAAEAQAAQQGPAAGDNAGAGQNADYVDTDYKDVDENGNK